MGRQTFASVDVADFQSASPKTNANSVNKRNLWVPALHGPIPAFDMKPGKVYQCSAGGIISCTGTPTIIFDPMIGTNDADPTTGNTTMGVSRTLTLGSGLTNVPWYFDYTFGVRSLGITAATATLTGNGQVSIQGVAAAVDQDLCVGGAILSTVDYSVATAFNLATTWGTASASNTITCQWVIFRSLN